MSIFVTRKLRHEGIDLLKKAFKHVEIWPENCVCPHDLLLEKSKTSYGILAQTADRLGADVLSSKTLKIVSLNAVGYDNVDLKAATKNKILIANTPGVLTDACADHAWALMLSAARHLNEAERYARAGKWKGMNPLLFLGTEFRHRTLGIIGPGRIGHAVARRSLGFDMRVLYNGPQTCEDDGLGHSVSLPTLLSESDYVVVTCTLNPSTIGLIGEKELKMMKPSAILVNISRGPVVNTDALVKALKNGTICAAGIDVFDPEPLPESHPLMKLENCVISPHIASAGLQTRAKMSAMAGQAIIDAYNGKKIQHCVNPEVYQHL